MQGGPIDAPVGAKLEGWTPPIRPDRLEIAGRYAVLERLDAQRHCAELFAANRLDDSIWTYLPIGPFAELEAYRDWVERVQDSVDPLFYAIRNRATGRAEGVASYMRISPQGGSIEAGYLTFSAALQRRPAATEAIYLMMKWAFEAGYRRFEWKCDALNRPSRRAAARYGLSFEGIFRQATVYKGRNRDTAWYAAIDAEWPSLHAAFEQWLAPSNFDHDGRQAQALRDLTAPILVARDDQG